MSQADENPKKTSQAILFGLALGDALGYPTEFLKLSQIKQQYGAQGILDPLIPRCIPTTRR